MSDEVLSPEQAADFLQIHTQTLRNYRIKGGGPPFYKPSHKIYYIKSELLEWLKTHKVQG